MNILNICNSGDVLSGLRIIKIVITIIRIVVPILLIVVLMINYTKAMHEGEDLSKYNKQAIIKVVSALIIFFIPSIINLVVKIADPNNNTYISCIKSATYENINNAYIEEARDKINVANSSLNRADYNLAQSSANKIKDKSDRDRVNSELSVVNSYISLKERIVALNNNYDKEEAAKLRKEINDVKDEEVKEKLLSLMSGGKPLGLEAGTFERSDYDSEMRYVEVIPEDATTNMPLMIYLHGIWSYASFSENAPNYYITNYVKSGAAYQDEKFILVIPRVVLSQGDANGYVTWKTSQGQEQIRKLRGLIDFLINKYQSNDRKIIITGVSLGGDGTWNMVESYPSLFSAAVPISGCAGGNAVASNYTSTAIIAYHGTGANEDAYKQCVPAIYNKIKGAGGNIQLRVKNGYSHGMMQNVYTENNGEIFKWMLEQEK